MQKYNECAAASPSRNSSLGHGHISAADSDCATTKVVRASTCLVIRGLSEQQPKKAADALKAELAKKEHCSEQLDPLRWEGDNFEDAVKDLEEFIDRMTSSEKSKLTVQVDTKQGGSSLVLRAMADIALEKAMLSFKNWKLQHENEKVKMEAGVSYPGSGPGIGSRGHAEPWFHWPPVSAADEHNPGARYDDVDLTSVEGQKVTQLMRAETGIGNRQNVWDKEILSVEKVVNPLLWRAYDSRCKHISKIARNSGSANELWVKHGTGSIDPRMICAGEAGVSNNHTRENCMFGRAAYTAENASYCDTNGYCYKQSDGTAQILLCKIAAGKVCEMAYSEASKALKQAPDNHDSVRGDVAPGRGFFALMVYGAEAVYPAYIVTYKP